MTRSARAALKQLSRPDNAAEYVINAPIDADKRLRYRGRIDRCAAHCKLSRRSISEKLRRYRINKADFKAKGTLRQEMALVEPS